MTLSQASPPVPVPLAPAWRTQLANDLTRLESDRLLRRLRPAEVAGLYIRIGDRRLINFASNDYLALAEHPHLKAVAINAINRYGTGARASRLVSGNLPIHEAIEKRFADFKHAESALLCPTGYMAAHAAITALAGHGDLICIDKLSHASLIDAARTSGAQVRVYPHLNLAKLERLLSQHASEVTGRRPTHTPLIITDTIFSMDGDCADLPALCELRDRFNAALLVDEAHGTGVLGNTGAGLSEHQGIADQIDIVISTASKALGGLGGIITASAQIIQTIINRARSFIYTTAVPPAQAATIGGALDVLHNEPERRDRLTTTAAHLRSALLQRGWSLPQTSPPTPILPLVVGDSNAAIALSDHLEARGVFAPPIRPPTVPAGAARVRISLRADLQDEDITYLLNSLNSWNTHAASR